MAKVVVRPGTRDERVLVLDSFTWEFAKSPAATGVPTRLLDWMMVQLLDAWSFIVAVEPDSEEILGFIVFQAPNRVAWLQTKQPYRTKGVARLLLAHAGIVPGAVESPFVPMRSNVSPNFPSWAASKGFRLVSRPWLPFVVSAAVGPVSAPHEGSDHE